MRLLWVKFFIFWLAIFPLAACEAREGGQPKLPTEIVRIVSAGHERAKITAELALRPKEQETGLMGRKKLPRNVGMMFIFPSNGIIRFWMKDTLIPLDMVFVDQDGRIIKIHERAKPKDETYISSDFQARAVLEIPAGSAKRYHLNLGDLVLSPTLDKIVSESNGAEE